MNHIARLNTDGTLDDIYDRNGGKYRVNTIVLQPDGNLIGGNFTTYNGTTSSTTSPASMPVVHWTRHLPGTGANNTVNTISSSLTAKSSLAELHCYNGITVNYIARLNASGSYWTRHLLRVRGIK